VFGAHSGLGEHQLRRRAKIINYALPAPSATP
jgi:hypothetical protein